MIVLDFLYLAEILRWRRGGFDQRKLLGRRCAWQAASGDTTDHCSGWPAETAGNTDENLRVLQFWTLPNCQEWSGLSKQQLRHITVQMRESPCSVNDPSLERFRLKW